VESQRVQEALQHIHHHQHRKSDRHEREPDQERACGLGADRVLGQIVPGDLQDFLQEDQSQL